MVIAPFLLPLLVHLGLAFPSGRVPGRGARTVVIAGYATAGVWALGRAVAGDPFLDRYCWANCTDNAFLLHADQALVDTLHRVWRWFAAGLGIVAVALGAWRLVRATPAARA